MEVVGIKFKNNSKVYYFLPNGLTLNENDAVIVETPSGQDIAYVKKGNFELTEEFSEELKPVVRMATNKDLENKAKLESRRDEVLKTTKELILKLNLDMKIVDVEFTLDGQKIIISYVCEDRVDFRELVKELAAVLKARIELKQIGIRDQAKIVGGIGICGQPCCCGRFLDDFNKVSIKMAKNQNLSLNPTKISGVCGRLMCCLEYENLTYAEALELMPKINSTVVTPDGEGTVVYNNILDKKCTIKFIKGDDVKLSDYDVENIKFSKPAIVKQNENKPNETKAENKQIKQENKKEHSNNKKQENKTITNSEQNASENKSALAPKKHKKHGKKNNNAK